MEKGIFPKIVGDLFEDGSTIKALQRCKEKYNNDGCRNFYNKLKGKEDGFYMCPSGLTVYKRTVDGTCMFYCSIRVKKFYDKKKKMLEQESINNPILSPELFEKMIDTDDEIRNLNCQLSREREIHKDLLHDIRKLDGLVKNKSEEILATYTEVLSGDAYDILQRVKNIQAMEELIACKYSVYDLVSNIDVLNMGNKSTISIYKKFDKVRYILFNYKSKGIAINFEGETEFTYKGNLIYFEMLPFLLLENAVKYSVNSKEVKVSFMELNGKLKISVDSFGPYCSKEEIPYIFTKNYRGGQAKKAIGEGNGIGLYLVKQICDQHGITIEVETEYVKKVNGVEYGYFTVNLLFEK